MNVCMYVFMPGQRMSGFHRDSSISCHRGPLETVVMYVNFLLRNGVNKCMHAGGQSGYLLYVCMDERNIRTHRIYVCTYVGIYENLFFHCWNAT